MQCAGSIVLNDSVFWGGGLGLLSSGEALVSVGACACVCGVKYCMNMKIAPINRLYFKF